ncbi:MAG: hypothetical protein NWF00_07305 [Candidatus Bathyarchaeota archaeon]|nr:hypothetical protein [Candidatus Bathyarchaeota archaeon]
MTYAIALIKGNPAKREDTHNLFMILRKDRNFVKRSSVEIQQIFVSFGWPDFVLILQAPNVELLKQGVIAIRKEAAEAGDELQTSTLICTTQEEISKKYEKWAHDSST